MKVFSKIARYLLVASLLGTASVHADPFITFGPNTRVVFREIIVDVGGTPTTLIEASVSQTEVDGTTGAITVRRQSEVFVPDGSGFERRITQEETVATPQPGGETFSVDTTTTVETTPTDGAKVPTAAPTPGVPVVVEDEIVDEDDLIVPPVQQFVPVDDELDEPFVFSPA